MRGDGLFNQKQLGETRQLELFNQLQGSFIKEDN